MAGRKYKPFRETGRIAAGSSRDPELIVYAFSYAYTHLTFAFALWSYLQNEGRYRLHLADAVDRLVCLTGYGRQHCQRIIAGGFGELWDRKDGWLQLRYPRILRRQSFDRIGVAKNSAFVMDVTVMGQGLRRLRAVLALPVIACAFRDPTPRAYTARCLAISLDTVSRFRNILRELDYIVTTPNVIRLGVVALGANGRRKSPPISGGGAWDDGHYRYRRGADFVQFEAGKLLASHKLPSLRSLRELRSSSPRWEGKFWEHWDGRAGKFGRLSDQYYELADSRPNTSDPSTQSAWMRDTLDRKLTTGARWRRLRRDPDALHRLLLAEAQRLAGQRRRCMDRAYHAPLARSRL